MLSGDSSNNAPLPIGKSLVWRYLHCTLLVIGTLFSENPIDAISNLDSISNESGRASLGTILEMNVSIHNAHIPSQHVLRYCTWY